MWLLNNADYILQHRTLPSGMEETFCIWLAIPFASKTLCHVLSYFSYWITTHNHFTRLFWPRSHIGLFWFHLYLPSNFDERKILTDSLNSFRKVNSELVTQKYCKLWRLYRIFFLKAWDENIITTNKRPHFKESIYSEIKQNKITLSNKGLIHIKKNITAFNNHAFYSQIFTNVFCLTHFIMHDLQV